MPFLHDHSKRKYHNSSKYVYPTPKVGFVAVLTKRNQLYEGIWDNNQRQGFGCFSKKINRNDFIAKYKGNYSAGKRNGFGNGYMSNGYYVGEWKNGFRHGYGKMWYTDGSFYAGDWKINQREGNGLFVQVNGDRYEGLWENNKKHGIGRLYHLNIGQMQEGAWYQDSAICTTLEDIPFRQSTFSTAYPIPPLHLQYPNIVIFQEQKLIFEDNERKQILDSDDSNLLKSDNSDKSTGTLRAELKYI